MHPYRRFVNCLTIYRKFVSKLRFAVFCGSNQSIDINSYFFLIGVFYETVSNTNL
ncbi:hypothetical protein LEP1GSC076_3016 [Leptospira sp. Fiocruz LV4135]|nr:hypothetical protein LEP1GSC076_3016 [Leptospira sp. Fiocruz LV4135]